MLAEGAGSFDLAYVDADKKLYDTYYERALALVRPGGVVALDNVLWSGAVADPGDQDHQTQVLRALNAKIRDDARVSPVLLPIGDGLMLAGGADGDRAQLAALRSSCDQLRQPADVDRARDQRLADDEAGRAVDAQASRPAHGCRRAAPGPRLLHLGRRAVRVVALAAAIVSTSPGQILGLHQRQVEVVVLAVVELGRRQRRLGGDDRIRARAPAAP